ncbi:RHS repeat-associated core domain-containing protein [Pseudomonas sp. BW16M2]|uniref:RHS repeat-associated core domain-containing protein n=1 Tax=Pseudomonas sp. BW16M2 TaxID=2745489 RepID=UPI001647AEC3|nr:RHS repeat-associated core domain-containing protein [Pseudomonas sp. BW16M2]MBC3434455.1 RHS repeat-associated core domain-containing protein [Pseudomonas sp. BW16M2]
MDQQQDDSTKIDANFLAVDQQQSILRTDKVGYSYSPFGGSKEQGRTMAMLGFTGALCEGYTGHYLLGNGYRGYSPQLKRFNSADSWSPFGVGGLNSYAYCLNDPVNSTDPSGHSPQNGSLWRGVVRRFLPRLNDLIGNQVQPRFQDFIDSPNTLAQLSVRVIEGQGRIQRSEAVQLANNVGGHLLTSIANRLPDELRLRQPSHRPRPASAAAISNMTDLYPAQLGVYLRVYPQARASIEKFSRTQAALYLRSVYEDPNTFYPDMLKGVLPEHLRAADDVLLSDGSTMDVATVLRNYEGRLR